MIFVQYFMTLFVLLHLKCYKVILDVCYSFVL